MLLGGSLPVLCWLLHVPGLPSVSGLRPGGSHIPLMTCLRTPSACWALPAPHIQLGFSGFMSSTGAQPVHIVSSDSKGQIHLLRVQGEGSRLQAVASWQAHGFEAWIAAFNYWQTQVVYSGELPGWESSLLEYAGL